MASVVYQPLQKSLDDVHEIKKKKRRRLRLKEE
jgi:hypothetical protein